MGERWTRIVGVVEDVKYDGPQGVAEPEAYVPYPYWPVEHLSVVLRTSGDPIALVAGAREAVRAVDPDLPLKAVRTLEAVFAETVAPPRFRFALVASFGLLAFGLALIGLYGVISQSVSQRAREIGIRLALGAAQHRVARMVLSETLLLATVGIALGAAGSLAASHVLAGLLFGTSATSAGAYAAAAVTIAAVALIASLGPARRAATLDPIVVLRAD
jgi:predicted lysophospholipase L1 biosynthesis ABC-type transport system permease subunit